MVACDPISLWDGSVQTLPAPEVKPERALGPLVLTKDDALRVALFGSLVMRHPAKQSLPQLAHIARRLAGMGIEQGSTILDVFGGAGSAMMLCSPLHGGHDVVTVELAAHFRAMQAQAWAHYQCTLDMQPRDGQQPGQYVSLAGDSRMLPAVLAAAGCEEGQYADAIVSSPPYRDALSSANGIDASKIKSRFGKHTQAILPTRYDAIVSSPSYGGSEAVDRRKKQNSTIAAYSGGNLARLRYDVAEMAKNSQPTTRKNIARMPVDTTKTGHGKHSQLASRNGDTDYGAENIGNERGKKYLASMAQVWQGAAQVLRPGGILVCITRDCVRDGKRVPVGQQNRELIEVAGLRFVECEDWWLTSESFWRVLQRKKAIAKGREPVTITSEQVQYFIKPEAV